MASRAPVGAGVAFLSATRAGIVVSWVLSLIFDGEAHLELALDGAEDRRELGGQVGVIEARTISRNT